MNNKLMYMFMRLVINGMYAIIQMQEGFLDGSAYAWKQYRDEFLDELNKVDN